MEYIDIGPITQVSGTIKIPGSKSISIRVLLLAALAEGTTRIKRLLYSDDVHCMLEALKILGINWYKEDTSGDLVVNGMNGIPKVKQAKLYLENAGIVFRSLTAVLAFSRGYYELSGTNRMHERPIGDLVDALRRIGADIRYTGNEGYPPLAIGPGDIYTDTEIIVKGNVSSQFLTALLIALPLTEHGTNVKVLDELISKPYVEITLSMLQCFGVMVEHDEGLSCFRFIKEQRYVSPGVIHVEGDASSASYFLAAGAIGGGPVRINGVGRNSIQGDIKFVEILASMGANVQISDDWIETASNRKLTAVDLDLNCIPDAAMTVAIVSLFAEGTTTLRNIGSWRVKETDRLSAMATELRKLGTVVVEGFDYIQITPPRALTPNISIDTYGDHRMAMCFSLVALGGIPVRINDPKCVTKTFPDYFDTLFSITN